MAGFDVIYKQTVTLFNRMRLQDGEVAWYPTIIDGVHLIVDKSANWDNYMGKRSDNARLHVRYVRSGDDYLVRCVSNPESGAYALKKWYEPKKWKSIGQPEESITFSFEENYFDFFIEGAFTELAGPISDDGFGRRGFYDYMNDLHDNVFSITSASVYNLIPHFEILAR